MGLTDRREAPPVPDPAERPPTLPGVRSRFLFGKPAEGGIGNFRWCEYITAQHAKLGCRFVVWTVADSSALVRTHHQICHDAALVAPACTEARAAAATAPAQLAASVAAAVSDADADADAHAHAGGRPQRRRGCCTQLHRRCCGTAPRRRCGGSPQRKRGRGGFTWWWSLALYGSPWSRLCSSGAAPTSTRP